MKKEKSPILVIGCILLLSTFIILPPLFRFLLPNTSVVTENPIQEKLQVLKCSKYFKQELYKVSSSVKYKNGLIDTNTITYEKLTQVPDDTLDNISITVGEEYNMFSSLNGVDIIENGTTTIVKINQSLIDNNLSNPNLLNYFQSLENQQIYYENMGYTCTVLES